MSISYSYDPYFKYTQLPKRWIRLLKIYDSLMANPPRHASELQQSIHISFENHEISSCPPYIALSYTWGEPTQIVDPTLRIFTKESRCYPVFCQGHLLRVTHNLRDALRRLRMKQQESKINPELYSTSTLKTWADLSKGRPELYWIDALCINQDNMDERSAQVALMGSIYKQATACLVWLGEKDDFTGIAMSTAVKLWNELRNREKLSTHLSVVESGRILQAKIRELLDLPQPQLQALAILFSRTWFSRLWIIQEVVLSPIVWAQCGPFFVDFECLMHLGGSLMATRAFKTRAAEQVVALKRLGLDVLAPGAYSYTQTPMLLAQLAETRAKLLQGKKSDFMEIARLVGANKTTEPRDRIYGILDITAEFDTQSGQTPIVTPDYSHPVDRIFTEAVIAVSRRRNDLSFLLLVCDQRWKIVPGLPSWCPDFSCCKSGLPARIGYEPLKHTSPFKKSFHRQPDIEFINKLLLVDGILYDVITRTSRRDSQDLSIQPIGGLLELAFHLGIDLAESLDALWRVILMDELNMLTPVPRAAAFFFPALCVWCLGMDSMAAIVPSKDGTTTQQMVESIRREAKNLISIVQIFRQANPHSSLILPSESVLCSLEMALRSFPTTGTPQDLERVCRQFLHKELQLIPDHAKKAGVEGQLKELMILDSALLQVRFEDVLQFFETAFLPTFRSRFPRLSIYSTKSQQLGVVRELIVPGDEIWLLHGLEFPVVLRPKNRGVYSFCGGTYIQGNLKELSTWGVSVAEEIGVRRIVIE